MSSKKHAIGGIGILFASVRGALGACSNSRPYHRLATIGRHTDYYKSYLWCVI